MTSKDLKEERRLMNKKINRRECLGIITGLVYLLTNQKTRESFNWIEEWAYPTEKQGIGKSIRLGYDEKTNAPIKIEQNQLYEIIIPDGGSYGLWYEGEKEWFKDKPDPQKLGEKIFILLNKTAHNIDPFKLKKDDKIRVADLNQDNKVMGVYLWDLLVEKKLKRISIDAIMGINPNLTEYKKQIKDIE
ncbi:hypothetical protein KY348_07095 [Candidatus Woesearchaeota archaeon]|nr:hypothetical protein [Candidatus Woesearchaeota archaeon]